MVTFTILQQGSDYTFIWHPHDAAQGAPSAPAALSCLTTTLTPYHQAELQSAIHAAAQATNPLSDIQALSEPPRSTPARLGIHENEEPLLRLGRLLFNHLLPLPLQEIIRRLPPATPLLICTNESELPWELLHDDQGFLALRHSVSRQLLLSASSDQASPPRSIQALQPQALPSQSIRCLLIGNPTGDLLAADTEIENLLELLQVASQPIRVEFLCREHASKVRVMAALASGDYDLIHFASHARPGALQMADGWLHAEEVQSILRGSPLIFLNACSSARTDREKPAAHPLLSLAGEEAHNLANAFLAGGARAFLGTAMPVEDGEIRWLALDFYRHLLNGHALGSALRQARIRTQSRGLHTTSWSAPVLYGAPLLRLPQSASQYQPGTVLSARLSFATRIQELTSHLVAILKSYGAELTTVRSDYLHALFGVPQPVEDDAVRALQAALEMRSLTQKEALGAGSTLAIAVASGEIAAGTIHAPLGRGEGTQGDLPLYIATLFGEAEALLAKCQPNQVLVNERASQLAQERFHFVPLLYEASGENGDNEQGNSAGAIPEPPIFEVTTLPNSSGAWQSAENPSLPGQLMGRQRELGFLISTWQEASGGRGQVVGIVGEAGVGKTRLLHEFRRSIASSHPLPGGGGPDGLPRMEQRGQAWIDLSCSSTGRDVPFRLVGQLLHKIFAIEPGDANEVVEAKIAERLGNLALGSMGATANDPQINQILREQINQVLGLSSFDLPVDERKARRGRLVHLLRTLMANEAQRRPLLIAIDDIHWMDEASLEVLAQLTEGIQRLPVHFVLLYRPEWKHSWFDKAYYRHLHLEQLDHEASLELLCMLLQSERLPDGLSALLQKTGGNPFFIEEMVKSLQETGILVQRPPTEAIQEKTGQEASWQLLRPLTEHYLPGTVERALRVRLQSLSPLPRQVLEVAAVIGPVFTLSLLQKLLEVTADAVEPALAELEQRGFVEARWGPTQEYRFCHALILDSVYHDLAVGQQQRWHRRIAELMEASAPPNLDQETVAHHYYHSLLLSRPGEAPKLDEQGNGQQALKGVQALIACGRRALERFAAREAITYYQRALLLNRLVVGPAKFTKFTPTKEGTKEGNGTEGTGAGDENEVICREGVGDALNVLGNFDAAYQELRLAYGALHTHPLDKGDRRRAADLARRIGRLCAWRGEHEEATQWMSEGLRQLGALENFVSGIAWKLMPDTKEEDKEVAALLHVHSSSVEYNRGNYEQAIAACEQGLQLAGEIQRQCPAQAEAYNMLGILAWAHGRNQEALTHYTQSHTSWLAQGNSYQAARVEGNMAVVYYYLAQWEQARLHHARCQAYWEQIEDQDMLAHPCLNLGNIYLCQGNWEQAEINFKRALTLWSNAHHTRFTALGHTNLGLLYIEQGQWAKAQTQLEESQAILTQANIRDLLPEALYALAEVALGQGDLVGALRQATEARDLALELVMPPEEALALRVLGRIALAQGDVKAALAHLQQALEILQGLNNDYEVGRTLYYLAQAQLADGLHANARLHVDKALEIFRQLGANHDRQRAEGLVDSLNEQAMTS